VTVHAADIVVTPTKCMVENCTQVACGVDFTLWLCGGKVGPSSRAHQLSTRCTVPRRALLSCGAPSHIVCLGIMQVMSAGNGQYGVLGGEWPARHADSALRRPRDYA
jgi:hypothetical protein